MSEIEHIIRFADGFHAFYKLGKMGMFEPEIQYIHCRHFMGAVCTAVNPAVVTIHVLIPAVGISQYTEPEFHIVHYRVGFLHMVNKHTGILGIPLEVPPVAPYGVFPGARDLLFLFVQQFQFTFHNRLLMGNSENIVES